MLGPIQKKITNSCASLLLFSGAAYFAGSKRCIQYFPKSNAQGFFTAAALGGVAAAGNQLHEKEGPKRHILLIGSIAASAFVALRIAKALPRTAQLAPTAAMQFAAGEAALYYGYEFCTSTGTDSRNRASELAQSLRERHELKPSHFPDVINDALFMQGFTQGNPPFRDGDHQKVIDILKALEILGLFDKKSQAFAKQVFQETLAFFDLEVTYHKGKRLEAHSQDHSPLNPDIFGWAATHGVQHDIINAARDTECIHLFSVASQYNAAEAPNPRTPPIGTAMKSSEGDHTQGPLAQRTNPVLFELVTAFLTHLGFNMMDEALPSAGKTYEEGSAIQHGYLRPTNQNMQRLRNELDSNLDKFEAPCYESRPISGGKPVYMILGAAPALGYSPDVEKTSGACIDLQYFSYIANFAAQFDKAHDLLQKNPSKQVVLHVTGTGLGVFGCDPELFGDAFSLIARDFQSKLTDEEKGRIRVLLKAHNGAGGEKTVGERLKLLEHQVSFSS